MSKKYFLRLDMPVAQLVANPDVVVFPTELSEDERELQELVFLLVKEGVRTRVATVGQLLGEGKDWLSGQVVVRISSPINYVVAEFAPPEANVDENNRAVNLLCDTIMGISHRELDAALVRGLVGPGIYIDESTAGDLAGVVKDLYRQWKDGDWPFGESN